MAHVQCMVVLYCHLGELRAAAVSSPPVRPLVPATAGSRGRRASRGERLGGPLPSLSHSLPAGSHTDTSCTPHFQRNSSSLGHTRSPSLRGKQKTEQGVYEMTILSPVCARSPQGPAATLQEGRPQREPGVDCWDRALLRGGGGPWGT